MLYKWEDVMWSLEMSSLNWEDYQACERTIIRAKNAETESFRQELLKSVVEKIAQKGGM